MIGFYGVIMVQLGHPLARVASISSSSYAAEALTIDIINNAVHVGGKKMCDNVVCAVVSR